MEKNQNTVSNRIAQSTKRTLLCGLLGTHGIMGHIWMQVAALRFTCPTKHIPRNKKSQGRRAAMRKARVDRVHLEDVKYLWEKTLRGRGERVCVWGGGVKTVMQQRREITRWTHGRRAAAPPETPPVNGWVDGAGAKEATVVLNSLVSSQGKWGGGGV